MHMRRIITATVFWPCNTQRYTFIHVKTFKINLKDHFVQLPAENCQYFLQLHAFYIKNQDSNQPPRASYDDLTRLMIIPGGSDQREQPCSLHCPDWPSACGGVGLAIIVLDLSSKLKPSKTRSLDKMNGYRQICTYIQGVCSNMADLFLNGAYFNFGLAWEMGGWFWWGLFAYFV